MRKVLSDRAELDARIYTFPSSMLKINGTKINYAQYLSHPSSELRAAMDRVVSRIDFESIAAFVAGVPYLTDLQREFYVFYLRERCLALFR